MIDLYVFVYLYEMYLQKKIFFIMFFLKLWIFYE